MSEVNEETFKCYLNITSHSWSVVVQNIAHLIQRTLICYLTPFWYRKQQIMIINIRQYEVI